jgi:hypothetical protein
MARRTAGHPVGHCDRECIRPLGRHCRLNSRSDLMLRQGHLVLRDTIQVWGSRHR